MALDAVLAILPTIADYTIFPIKRHLGYTFNYKSKVENLRNQVEKLKSQKDGLQQEVDAATRRGDAIKDDVQQWLNKVNVAIQKADQELIIEEQQAKEKCFHGLIPNLKRQHRLGRKAAKEDPEFTMLQEEGRFNRISYRPSLKPFVDSSLHGNQALHSRALMLKNVMDALMDPAVNMVGVCGTGGIGKTTLAKEIRRQAVEAKLFDVVVLTHVSETPDLKIIQGNIADMLSLELHEETVEGRAHRLSQRLAVEKKVLLILDDVWNELELERVGIPFGSNQQGCKILLTSRNHDVLSQKMGAQVTFELGGLSEAEARSLFENMVGEVADQTLATQIVKKCAGLPVLIVTVAIALKNKGLHEWKVALKELSRFDNKGFQERVYSAVELSYRHLGSDEVKSFFLLCAQLAQNDIPIPCLLYYNKGLDLLRHTETVEDGRNKILKLINDLKAACLLVDGDRYGFVKMHDVIRDAAVLIAPTTQRAFTFRDAIGLRKFPITDLHGNCTRIYLPRSEIHEFPERLEFPEAELLVLGTGGIYETDTYPKIPDSFFEGITKLKVLHFTGMCLWSLPSSFDSLADLRTLYLEDCALGDTGIIGKLKRLEILSFRGSRIKQLSKDIGQLTELKLLSLSECFNLKTIPANVLSRLSLLEELHMRYSFNSWETEGSDGQRNASLAELKLLSHLTTLVIDIPDTKMLPRDLFSSKLENYRIAIGHKWYRNEENFFSSALKLNLDTTNIQLDHGVRVLLKGTEHLSLWELKGIWSILYELDWEGFLKLKYLEIYNAHAVHYIISSTEQVPCTAFPILESLILVNLISLENICNCQLTIYSFNKLRVLKVERCNKLKNLLSFSMVENLSQLQELEVSNCEGMEEIVSGESEVEDNETQVAKFPQLRSLKLRFLPMLRRFCSIVKQVPPSQTEQKRLQSSLRVKEIVPEEDELHDPLPFFDRRALFPNLEVPTLMFIAFQETPYYELSSNLTSSSLSNSHDVKYLFASSIVNNLLQLKKLEVNGCKFLEGIVLTQEFGEEETTMKDIFSNLHVLELQNLSNLKRFCDGYFIEFPSLIKLSIGNCPALKTFITGPPSAAITDSKRTVGVNLEKNQCTPFPPLFDEKVAFPSLEHMDILSMSSLGRVWDNNLSAGSFCKLKSMSFSNCESLRTVFPSNDLARFQRLERLVLNFCPLLEEIFQLPEFGDEESSFVMAFELRYLDLGDLRELKRIWSKDPQGICTFKNLQFVHVDSCKSLNSLFPISIVKDLLRLERVELRSSGVEALIEKREGVEAAPSFVFPELVSLELQRLNRLRSFYPEAHSLQFPKLKYLRLVECGQVMEFASEFLTFHGHQPNNRVQQSLFLAKKVFPDLEKLTLDGPVMEMISQCRLPMDHLSSVKYVDLKEYDKDESVDSLFGFIQRLFNLETLHVRDSDVRELMRFEGFHHKNEDDNVTLLLPRIRNLELLSLCNLTYIWKQDSQLNYILEYLQVMKVVRCHSLLYLVPSSATFRSLTTLEVYACDALQHLLTSSTAKRMVHLTKMKINSCKMLADIVTGEADETAEEIVFSNLNTLELFHSQSLTGFCLGSFNFKFPSLEIVIVFGCPNMGTFSAGTSSAPKLQCVHFGPQRFMNWFWEGSLNSTIQKLYTEKIDWLA